MLKIFHTDMRMWRNGRRACLRGKFERVGVRPSPSAPTKKADIIQSFLFSSFKTNTKFYFSKQPTNTKMTTKKRQIAVFILSIFIVVVQQQHQ